jgi:cytochrome b6-f complex iron-sulfur subunit
LAEPSCAFIVYIKLIIESKNMERREFLEKLGIGAAFVITSTCMQSCSKDSSGPVDFTLNLDDAANANLKANGGYVVSNSTVVARTLAGDYVAVPLKCSHDGLNQVQYRKSSNTFFCTAHGAEFSLAGSGLNSTGKNGLTLYKTTLTGTSLRVVS